MWAERYCWSKKNESKYLKSILMLLPGNHNNGTRPMLFFFFKKSKEITHTGKRIFLQRCSFLPVRPLLTRQWGNLGYHVCNQRGKNGKQTGRDLNSSPATLWTHSNMGLVLNHLNCSRVGII